MMSYAACDSRRQHCGVPMKYCDGTVRHCDGKVGHRDGTVKHCFMEMGHYDDTKEYCDVIGSTMMIALPVSANIFTVYIHDSLTILLKFRVKCYSYERPLVFII